VRSPEDLVTGAVPANALQPLAVQFDEVARLNDTLAPFRILTGIEVDILELGGCERAAACGVTSDRAVNTRDAAGLLDWTRRRG
jgi:hypothetical protein